MGVKKSLGGIEDLALGTGVQTQLRNGQEVQITEINADNIPYDATRTIKQVVDPIKSTLDSHRLNTNNPHQVSKDQVGVGFVTDQGPGTRFLADDGLYKYVQANLTEHNNLSGRDAPYAHPISSITDLQTELDSKAAEVHGHQISDVSGLQSALDAKMDDGDAFLKSEHIVESTGSADAGKPIITDSTGKLHASLAGSGLVPYGEFTPVDTAEYPDTSSANPGAYWMITGVGDAGYTWQGGDLQGDTAYDGDYIVYGQESWILRASSSLDPTDVYFLDGRYALTAPMAGGGQQAKNFAAGSEAGDLVTYEQIANFATEFVKADGTIPFTGNADFGGFQAKNLADGSESTDAVTLSQLNTKADVSHVHDPADITPQGADSGLDADTVDGLQPADFPISTATQSALDEKVASLQEGTVGTLVYNMIGVTQDEYDTLTPDPNTLYLIYTTAKEPK